MKRLLLFTAAAALCGSTLRAADFSVTARDEKDVLKLEQEWSAALVKRDVAAIEKIEADDFTLVDPMGNVSTKAQDLANYRDGTIQFESLNSDNLKVRVYGGGAIVTGHLVVKGKYKDTDISGDYLFTDLFERRKNGWQAVYGQLTKVTKQ